MPGAGRRSARPTVSAPAGRPPRPARWGWHQLRPDWATRLVEAAGVRPGELVYDLGAGRGVITGALLQAGAQVIAVERHPGRVEALRERFGEQAAQGRVRILAIDLRSLRPPPHRFRVVANPPFDQTGVLLRTLTRAGSGLHRADLVLQRDVVRRWSSQPEDDTAGRSRLRGRFQGRRGLDLPPSAFRPPPSVPTAVLQLRRF